MSEGMTEEAMDFRNARAKDDDGDTVHSGPEFLVQAILKLLLGIGV